MNKQIKQTINIVFKAVGTAMGVAVAVISSMGKIVGFFGIILGATLIVIERYFIHIPNVVAITLYAVAVIMIVIGVIGNRMSSNCNQRNSEKRRKLQMNKEWSEKNQKMQSLLKKDTFADGIAELLELRRILMKEIISWKELTKEDFCAIPFINAKGYHSKTIAYSLWHIFRIEDIVVNSLICGEDEVLFRGSYARKMNSPIITTGNELKGTEIAEFSQKLDIDILYQYIEAVMEKTNDWLLTIDYSSLKKGFDESDKERLRNLAVVSNDEDAIWLIDYWCDKDIKGLIKMPLSRHWIMHVEAALRIKNKLECK